MTVRAIARLLAVSDLEFATVMQRTRRRMMWALSVGAVLMWMAWLALSYSTTAGIIVVWAAIAVLVPAVRWSRQHALLQRIDKARRTVHNAR